MSKGPTEAELIGLTDNLGLIELFHEFLEFLTMKKINPLTIYQVCNAVVSLVTKGGGQTRTKHLRARMNLGKEMVDEKRAEVKHICAEGMEADGFSKPYDPVDHKKFVMKLVMSINGDNGWALSKVETKPRTTKVGETKTEKRVTRNGEKKKGKESVQIQQFEKK
jgi:hypothetical protein